MTEILLDKLTEKVKSGYQITKEEAIALVEVELEELCKKANELREFFCKDGFDLCTIVNGKSGRCQEDCKYCAQSSYYKTKIQEYPLLKSKEIVEDAKEQQRKGVIRYSIVTSGRKLSPKEVEYMCDCVKELKKETDIDICSSFGLLEKDEFAKLKEAGITRIHNNLETSRRNFSNICTTHTYEDKIKAIKDAKAVGLNVCSGGIMGLGETMEDRVDMALDLRELGIKSIPINMLNAIAGTPYEGTPKLTNEEMRRVVAIYRFINPDSSIRLAGGRGLLADKGKSCFESGANAAISGDMLTTVGITVEKDLNMIKELGYTVRLWDR